MLFLFGLMCEYLRAWQIVLMMIGIREEGIYSHFFALVISEFYWIKNLSYQFVATTVFHNTMKICYKHQLISWSIINGILFDKLNQFSLKPSKVLVCCSKGRFLLKISQTFEFSVFHSSSSVRALGASHL